MKLKVKTESSILSMHTEQKYFSTLGKLHEQQATIIQERRDWSARRHGWKQRAAGENRGVAAHAIERKRLRARLAV
jgi:hypothetical protein